VNTRILMSNLTPADWAYHLPNFLLAVLMYTLLGRLALALIVPPGVNSVVLRVFERLTDPIVAVVRFITPNIAPKVIVLAFAVVWLFIARFVFLAVMAETDVAPSINEIMPLTSTEESDGGAQ